MEVHRSLGAEALPGSIITELEPWNKDTPPEEGYVDILPLIQLRHQVNQKGILLFTYVAHDSRRYWSGHANIVTLVKEESAIANVIYHENPRWRQDITNGTIVAVRVYRHTQAYGPYIHVVISPKVAEDYIAKDPSQMDDPWDFQGMGRYVWKGFGPMAPVAGSSGYFTFRVNADPPDTKVVSSSFPKQRVRQQ